MAETSSNDHKGSSMTTGKILVVGHLEVPTQQMGDGPDDHILVVVAKFWLLIIGFVVVEEAERCYTLGVTACNNAPKHGMSIFFLCFA
jgi:hypothetical protein